MRNKTILFICKGNSGRSQMAESFFNHLSNIDKAISAGTDPDKKIHPLTIQVMKEVGINMNHQKPKLFTDEIAKKANRIIIMDTEPLKIIPTEFLPKLENWHIEKLLGKPIERIRKIRGQIKKRVENLIKELE